MNNNLMFSSANEQWDTSPKLVKELATVFDWTLDVCASGPNVCEHYFDVDADGLSRPWPTFGVCWMNPPYGREVGDWMEKARKEAMRGVCVVCLVASRTDTRWWHDTIPFAAFHVQIKGRLTFGSDAYWQYLWDTPMIPDGNGKLKKNPLYGKHGRKNSAPFPSAFIVLGNGLSIIQENKLASYGMLFRSRE